MKPFNPPSNLVQCTTRGITTGARALTRLLLMVSLVSTVWLVPGAAPTAAADSRLAALPALAGGELVAAVSSGTTLMFIENVGQFDELARFQVRGGNTILFLADDGLWVTLIEPTSQLVPSSNMGIRPALDQETEQEGSRGVNLKLSFVGANPHPHLEPLDELDAQVSFFAGNDSAQWKTRVPAWSGVRYVDLYPGIDLEISGQNGRLEQRLIVRDVSPLAGVRLRVEGAEDLTLEGNRLRLTTALGDFSLPLLTVEGAQPDAQPAVLNRGPGTYEVAAPFASRPAFGASSTVPAGVSDLVYSTYLGGSCDDRIRDIVMDSEGNIYVTGQTASVDFPPTPGVFDTSNNDGAPNCQINDYTGEAFVAKLSADGRLLYSTYLGGNSHDSGIGIAVDDEGNAFIAGLTYSTDFPTTPGALDTTLSGGRDVFVAKLSPDGSTLLYSTYLGGNSWEYGLCIAIDDSGHAYVGGFTHGNFPITSGAAQTTFSGSSDGFATKLSPDGSTILYSTYLGGYSWDTVYGIVVDGAGNAYLACDTHSTNFRTTPGAWDRTCDNCQPNFSTDAAVAKLNADGSQFIYSTLVGGSGGPGREEFRDIALDDAGNTYLMGNTPSTDFPTTSNALQTSFAGGVQDAVVVKLNADGSDLLYSTYLGGTGTEWGFGIAIDDDGNAYVTGYTDSADFPTVDPLQAANAGGYDAFLAKLNADSGELLFSTYLGGSNAQSNGNEDYNAGVVLDEVGNIYLAGATGSANFPVTEDAVQTAFGSVRDGFVTKIAAAVNTPPDLTAHQATVTVDEGQTAINSGTVSDLDGDPVTLSPSVGTVTNNGDGTWSWRLVTGDGPAEGQIVTIYADDGRGGSSQITFDLTVDNVAPTTGEITAPTDPVQANTEISASADFSDPGVLDTHTGTWDWGDGSTSAGTVNETSGSGTVTGKHSYASPGVYTVKLAVVDKDGDSGVSIYQFVVVYDPEGGFVTGSGWIESPPGAYAPDPALTGKATFGFVSKYKKGASKPDGSTEFQLKAGELNFHSSAYDWLVIANHKAQYKGTGTVNGAGNYGVMLTAIDADLSPTTEVDLFRIKIWDKDNRDAVIYDNQMGTGDGADAGTQIGGGSIVIHQAKGKE